MSRAMNVSICNDNRQIVKNNGYRWSDDFVELPCNLEEHQKVVVLSPDLVNSIMEDEDDFFELSFWGSSECNISVINADSFAHRTSLVMNFANE